MRRSRRTPSWQAEQALRGISNQIDDLHEQAQATSLGVPTSPRFQLVVVCTGNRFRSPLAAAVVQELVSELPVEVSSLGTLDLHGSPPLRSALKEADRFGLDLSDHRARTLVGTDLSHADLIIGFERAHVGAAVLEARAPRERTFLLTELVELLDGSPALADDDPLRRARAAVARADAARREDPVPWQEEIPDPLGGPSRLAREVAANVQRLTVALVRELFGVESAAPLPTKRRARWRR